MKQHENKLEIAELIGEVSRNLDKKDLNKVLEAFSADAEFTIEEDGKAAVDLTGREAIREHIASHMEKYDLIFHNNGSTVVDLIHLDQSATAATSCIVKTRTNDPIVTTDEYVYYLDSLVKVNGFWYIVKRTIQIESKSVR